MQQPEPERAPRVAARVRVGVLGTVRVAVKVKVRAVLVCVRMQVPAPARVAQDDRPAEPDRLWPAADFLVALLLIGLGGSVILRYARGRWHLHVHSHAGAPHLHLHSHAQGTLHEHAHPQGDARRSLGFGLLHGLAGSAAILVLLVAAAPTRAAQLAYFLSFAAGTMIGIPAASVSLASVVRLASTRGARWARVLHVGSALASVAVGLVLASRVAGEVRRR